MAIDGVRPDKIVSIEQLRRQRRPASSTGRREAEAADPKPLTPEDRNRLLMDLKAEWDGLPEVRDDKVIEAKLRISTGFYDQEEIRRRILRSVLDSLRRAEPGSAPSDPTGADAPPEPGP